MLRGLQPGLNQFLTQGLGVGGRLLHFFTPACLPALLICGHQGLMPLEATHTPAHSLENPGPSGQKLISLQIVFSHLLNCVQVSTALSVCYTKPPISTWHLASLSAGHHKCCHRWGNVAEYRASRWVLDKSVAIACKSQAQKKHGHGSHQVALVDAPAKRISVEVAFCPHG